MDYPTPFSHVLQYKDAINFSLFFLCKTEIKEQEHVTTLFQNFMIPAIELWFLEQQETEKEKFDKHNFFSCSTDFSLLWLS